MALGIVLLTMAALVGYLPGIATMQSVKIKPLTSADVQMTLH